MLIKVVYFECQAVDVTGINPARIETYGNTIPSPTTPRLHFAGAWWFDTEKFMGVSQNALTRAEGDDGVIGWNAFEQFQAVFFAILFVRHRLFGFPEITRNISLLEGIVNRVVTSPLRAVVIMPECYVEARVTNMPVIKRHTNDVFFFDGISNLGVAINRHERLQTLVTPPSSFYFTGL